MNNFVKIFDYFFVLRPTLFFPVWTVFLANYHAKLSFDEFTPRTTEVFNPVIIGTLLTMLMGSAFIINQIKDIVSDKKNNKLFIIADGYIKKKDAIIEALILLSVAMILAFYLNFGIGIVLSSVFIVTGILYNLKPFEWKDKTFFAIIANFLGGITVASVGWISSGIADLRFLVYATPYGLGLLAVYFLTTLADIKGDAEAGKITIGVKYGFKISVFLALIFEVAAITMSFYLKDYILFIPALISLPLFVITAITQKLEDALRTIKFSVLFVSIAVCIKFPYYFIILVALFYFSKWYYKRRFNIDYPRFAA
ncbi:hypothetical protein GF337_13615 [candidate division KSB1 bacterium]|nr:hypothetical protein [candidate division KSB1 bacterium]